MLGRALRGPCSPVLRLLPDRAAGLLEELLAPPRLAAHLRLVHDVACQLADWTDARHLALRYDRDAMLFGAATHDIGKAAFPAEITGPGSAHEEAGRQLLLSSGVSADLARFAATHASWDGPGISVEDLMVSVADKAWKNKRVADLEGRLVTSLAHASGRDAWQEFADLDTLLEAIGDGADDRDHLAAHPPRAGRRGAMRTRDRCERSVTCRLRRAGSSRKRSGPYPMPDGSPGCG
jgi:HD domain